jgi:hypothetical protein
LFYGVFNTHFVLKLPKKGKISINLFFRAALSAMAVAFHTAFIGRACRTFGRPNRQSTDFCSSMPGYH